MSQDSLSYRGLTAGDVENHWDGGICECCCGGDEACGICCVGCYAPFVLFGWNRARAERGASGIKWGCYYLLAPMLGTILVLIAYFPMLSEFLACQNRDMDQEQYEKCQEAATYNAMGWIILMRIFLILGFVARIWLGCWNRGQLRKKFNIKGDACGDCMLHWFCAPCSICQETRTLSTNNVRDGEWLGPNVMMVAKPVAESNIMMGDKL